MGHDVRVLALALGGGLPATLVALGLLWLEPRPLRVSAALTLLVTVALLAGALAARDRVARKLRTLSNLLAALREGDFTIRGHVEGHVPREGADALSEAFAQANALATHLRERRLSSIEASHLLAKVLEEIDVAVFAFDEHQRLELVNRAGAALLGRSVEDVRGKSASALGIAALLTGDVPRTVSDLLIGGPYELRRRLIRQDGAPHTLVVLADVRRVLREEERRAWQGLVRVLGHEINNSLAPIRSIAENLHELVARDPRPADWQDDVFAGLQVVSRRAEALGRFTTSYARLARLPPPDPRPLDVGLLLRRVVSLERRLAVAIDEGALVIVPADADQLEQLVINLVSNAVEAALETGGGVRVSWTAEAAQVVVTIVDDGPGLSSPHNLFVPFFTTKQSGSGIGLVLARQIAEAHGGRLVLENREDGVGARARLSLPLGPSPV